MVFVRVFLCLISVFILSSKDVKAAGSLLESADELSKQIVSKALPDGTGTIAVSTITHSDNTCSELSNFYSEQLIDSLFNANSGGFSIIERRQLDAIFKELNLVYDGTVAPDTAKKIGEIEGVKALVIGRITEFGDRIIVQGRLISTVNGKVFSTARTSFPKTDTVTEMMRKRTRIACGYTTNAANSSSGAITMSDGLATGGDTEEPDLAYYTQDLMNDVFGAWVGTLSCGRDAWRTKFNAKSVQGFVLNGVFEYNGSSKGSVTATLSFNPPNDKGLIPVRLVTDGGDVYDYNGSLSASGVIELYPLANRRCEALVLSKV